VPKEKPDHVHSEAGRRPSHRDLSGAFNKLRHLLPEAFKIRATLIARLKKLEPETPQLKKMYAKECIKAEIV